MSTILFSADERTMDNLMEGPWVSIEAEPSTAQITALFNKAGFEKYAHLVDEYDCTGFSIAIEDIAEDRLQAEFSPCLDRIKKKDAISHIGIVGSGAFAQDFDMHAFSAFKQVTRLTTQNVPFGPALTSLFPKLQAWQSMDWKANQPTALHDAWPQLARLSLQGFSGSLDVFDGRPIKTLMLVASTIKNIEDILRFQDLESLQIISCRIGGDVSVLSTLEKLQSLRIEGKNKLVGWEALTSATIRYLEASHYPCKFPKVGFPALQHYVVNAYRARDPFADTGGDADEINDALNRAFFAA
ncbi:hypothetical protein FXN63_07965 [Pigmentiphaga aceris]|uniref:Leucine-rich repeat domain-containing protein n=1 Tax=Pigmentiphaga aceris TaxID=1940612 RepID=A0A5C0AY81_9BURK|nr:hypothetical protein [Pigmentiphaga aceris]QEI05790.1 hypothetical protein FXN63_07965 [Pigmentiphaga aceris]